MEVDRSAIPSGFTCHISLVDGLSKVFRGLYSIDLDPPPATILDIGANAGSFTLWALKEWPEAHITAYEPSASTLRHLYKNVDPATRNGRVEIIGRAVTIQPGPVALFDGAHNTGERSLYPNADNTVNCESVDTIHPKDLPRADLLKLDCEASEHEILMNYPHLETVRAVVMEWHRPPQLPEMINRLADAGLRICANDRSECMLKFRRDSDKVTL